MTRPTTIPPTAPVKTATQTLTDTPSSLIKMNAAIINIIEEKTNDQLNRFSNIYINKLKKKYEK